MLASEEWRQLVLVFISCAIGLGTIGHQFTYDDYAHVVNNPYIQSLSKALDIFKQPTYPGTIYRPITVLTFAIDYAIGLGAPWMFHLTNILLHSANVILLYKLLRYLFGPTPSFWTALLFAVHPLNSEVISNISNRNELLAAFFGFMALLLSQKRGHCYWLLGLGLALSSMLAKESAVTLLGLALLIAWYRSQPISKPLSMWLLAVVVYLCRRVSVLGGLSGTWQQVDFLENPLVGTHGAEKVLSAVSLLGRYVSLIVCPQVLSADYSYAKLTPLRAHYSFEDWGYLCVIFCVATLALVGLKNKSSFGFFATWFLISFATTANIFFSIGTIFAERLTYIPKIGLLGLIVVSLERAYLRRLVLTGLAVIYGLKLWRQDHYWFDNRTLFAYQMSVSAQSAKTLVNYAGIQSQLGLIEQSNVHLSRAISIYPPLASAYYALALNSLLVNKVKEAEDQLEKTLQINPGHSRALSKLVQIKLSQGDLLAARERLNKGRQLFPMDIDLMLADGLLLIREGRLAEANNIERYLESTVPESKARALLQAALKAPDRTSTGIDNSEVLPPSSGL